MAVRIVQLGTPRDPAEGLRIGTVRRPPRGVPKREFAKRNFYDAWLPDLSPTEALRTSIDRERNWWPAFARRFKGEMKRPEAARLLDLLAALSHESDFSVGCYCEDEARCHRSVLKELLEARGAKLG